MAMRFRHLEKISKEAVGVYRYPPANVQMKERPQLPRTKTFLFFFSFLDLKFTVVDFSAKGTSRPGRWWSSTPARSSALS